ncbi:phage tail tape measure protein [Clostridium sp. HBUAS56017]|uniref:phage tail tape measure protein n=1 Tax=Clostridium sp. HBUAS56017 TaxID=2571128 RepID=UPI0011773711|nr:phage tail tape measure protein [Clostridium sp. HBUAS56017]
MAGNIKGITVEIGGNTAPLDNALKDINKTSSNLQSELNQVKKALKFDSSSTEMLSQKQKILTENISNTKKKLEILKEAEKQVEQQFAEGKINEEQYRALQREIQNTEGKLKNLQGQLNNAKPSLQAFGEKAGEVGEKLKATGEKITGVGKSMSAKVTAPIVAGIGVASKLAGEFEHQIADIRKEVEATGIPIDQVDLLMDEMRKSSLQWSEDFGQSTDGINEGLLTLVKDGYSASEAMKIMETSLYTARGANEELATVVDQLGSSLEAYGMKTNDSTKTTENAAHMADSFAYISNHTKASITSLGEAFSVVGATANSLHQPMTQTAAAIGILESNGIEASTAATSLQAGLVNLTKPTKKMQQSLKEMNFTAFDSKGNMKDLGTILNEMEGKMSGWTNKQKEAAIATIFGKESLASWNVLLHKGGDYLTNLANNADNANGEVKHLSDSMKDTPVNKVKELKESTKALGVTFGEDILPMLTPIIEEITAMIKSFASLDSGTKKMIINSALVFAAVGPLLIFLGTIVEKIGSLGVGISKLVGGFGKMSTKITEAGGLFNMLTKPITSLTSVLGTLGGKVVSAFGTFGSALGGLGGKMSTIFLGPWKLLVNSIKSLPGLIGSFSLTGIVSKIISPFKSIPGLLSGIFGKIPGILGVFKNALIGLGSTVIGLGPKIFKALRSAFSVKGVMTAARAALTLFTGPWGILALTIAATVGAIIKNWDKIKNWVAQHFGGTLPTTFNQFKEKFIQIWNSIQEAFTKVWNAIKDTVMKAWDYISPTIMGAINKIKAFWDQVWPEIKQVFVEVWNVMKVVLAPIVTELYIIISGALGLIKGIWGPAWEVIKDTFKIVWDAITGVIKVAWDIISGVIKVGLDLLTGHWGQAWDDFKSIFVNVWHDLGDLIGNIASDALEWGKDIIEGIIKGIKGAIGGIVDAVKDVANTIRSYLHFSVPDVGPLVDYESWMPDFMQGLAEGIQNSKYLVTSAIKDLSTDINVGMQLNPSSKKFKSESVENSAASQRKLNGGVNQTLNFYGKTESPYEVAKASKKALRDARFA